MGGKFNQKGGPIPYRGQVRPFCFLDMGTSRSTRVLVERVGVRCFIGLPYLTK